MCRSMAPALLCGLYLATCLVQAEEPLWPAPQWQRADPAELGLDVAQLEQARDYALTPGGSGLIVVGGRLVMSWGDQRALYDLKSTSKSIGATALGLAIGDGKIRLADKARTHHPTLGLPPESNARTGWLDEITILHLATQTAGFEKPGGYGKLLFRPGTQWHYSDAGPNWLAECVTLAYGRDLDEVMFERVFGPLGITRDDLKWRRNSYRPRQIDAIERREFGSGFSANVDAMARIGYLYLRGGRWQQRQILPADFVSAAGAAVAGVVGLEEFDGTHGNASDHYGLLWWNNADGTLADVPRDAYWSWGLYDSLILVVPSLDLVAARAGSSWPRSGEGHYAVLDPFFEPLVAGVRAARSVAQGSPPTAPLAPCPPSGVIAAIQWAPADTIVRTGRGGDNWPVTWGDDDLLYTAYGDGNGFEPRLKEKLSLGLAVVGGMPDDLVCENLRAPTAESKGDGRRGEKASGMLMVDGVLYMWVRNAANSQLLWSDDHGRTWLRADWKFTTSFGCPTFLNFGRNYAGARDEYVYVYSHDSDSAYEPADRMVLARVKADRIARRHAYEFFQQRDAAGQAVWTSDIQRRGAVFEHAARCYRSSVTYNAPIKRYLWCQTLPGNDPRFEGGLGIYDAPAPWGPWTTAFYTERWDVGPGETSSLPTRWMSADGRTVHLLFSGDDSFSVRRATLKLHAPPP